MKLRLSVVARDRQFSKAIRRIRPRFDQLLKDFEKVELVDPIHEAILVGITDDKTDDYFEEVSNRDGFFQIMAGCGVIGSDEELTVRVFQILQKAATACPFSKPDKLSIQHVFDSHSDSFSGPQS